MKLFANKEVKNLFIMLAAIFFIFAAAELIAASIAADGFKGGMIRHDFETAGFLARKGVDENLIVRAFASDKTALDAETGRRLLKAAGYDAGIPENLLPAAGRFHRGCSIILMAAGIVFPAAVFYVFLRFVSRHYGKIEKAASDLRLFIAGNTGIRLDDCEEGSLSGLFALINSLSASQAALIEKERQSGKFLKDMISDISHQLKTPLAALRLYNEIIMDENTGNAAVDSFTQKCSRELDRMEFLVRNLLKLAMLDAGSVNFEKKPHDLREFLDDVIKSYQPRANLEGKTIPLRCDENITLPFDKEWMREAIGNIIKNALDYTGPGGFVEVSCNATPILAEIVIKDNGEGIHPDDIHHIFKRFYRSRRSRGRQGTGIGLALSKSVAEKHGGSITAESEPGKGTAFRVLLPKLTNL